MLDLNPWFSQAFVDCGLKCTSCNREICGEPLAPSAVQEEESPQAPTTMIVEPPQEARRVRMQSTKRARLSPRKDEPQDANMSDSGSSSSSSKNKKPTSGKYYRQRTSELKGKIQAILAKRPAPHVFSESMPVREPPSTNPQVDERPNDNRRSKYKYDRECMYWHEREFARLSVE